MTEQPTSPAKRNCDGQPSLAPATGSAAFSRTWDMPSADTFSVPAIGCFVKRYLLKSKISIDPFARNSRLATYRNDLNPETAAQYHMEALDFLKAMKQDGVKADLVIFDPPYSARQVAECYAHVGRKTTMQDTQGKSWTDWKAAIAPLVAENGIVLSFGWNTNGMGKKHGFEIIEVMLVAHGGVRNDTICMAEKKLTDNQGAFGSICSRTYQAQPPRK